MLMPKKFKLKKKKSQIRKTHHHTIAIKLFVVFALDLSPLPPLSPPPLSSLSFHIRAVRNENSNSKVT